MQYSMQLLYTKISNLNALLFCGPVCNDDAIYIRQYYLITLISVDAN